MTTTIRMRRGTAAQWTAADPVLAAGEPGVETDTGRIKVGDGVTSWNARPYASDGSFGSATASMTMSALLDVLSIDTTAGAVTVTLPAASGCTGKQIRIIKTAGSNALLLARAGSDTITPSSGARTSVAFPSDCASGEIVLVSTGTAWHVVSGQASDETVGSRAYRWEQAKAASSTSAAVGWSLIRYDSGRRNVTGELDAAFAASNPGFILHVRRTATLVQWSAMETSGGTATGNVSVWSVPTGFANPGAESFADQNECFDYVGAWTGESLRLYRAALTTVGWTAKRHYARWQTMPAEALPTSLPGIPA